MTDVPFKAYTDALAAERLKLGAVVAVGIVTLLFSLRAADERARNIKAEGDAYKGAKGNELREQLSAERLNYATKADIAPLTAYVLSQQGRGAGISTAWAATGFVIMLIVAIVVPLVARLIQGT